MNQPNIVYMHSHDTGRYVQPYGFAVPTPHIQKLAEEGVLFRQAFCAAPTCTPSRAALLTGQSPHSCGQLGLINLGFELRDSHKHIAHTLRDARYHTVMTGAGPLVRDSLTCGYDAVIDGSEPGDPGIAEAASAFLSRPHDKPFFLAVGFLAPHRDFPEPGPAEDPRHCLPPAPLPDTPQTRRDMAAFKASARRLDACFGTVLEAIESNGLTDNTLVVCTTDHGLAFPFMKCCLTDHGTGVMLILRGPSGFTGGKVIDAMVSHIDIFPTLCEVADIPPPEWLEGKSMLPLIRGAADEINEHVFSEVNYHCPYEPMRAVRTSRWKYIRRYSSYEYPMPSNIDDSASKAHIMEHGYAGRGVQSEELYDLVFDPNEAGNRSSDPGHAEVLQDMRSRLDNWMQETKDPLLSGDIPQPAGTVAGNPDDESPKDISNRVGRPEMGNIKKGNP